MGDLIVRTGDMLKVTITPPAVVPMLEAPIPMVGTGETVLAAGPPICLEGDQIPPTVRVPMPYTSPPFVTPGVGTLQLVIVPPVNLTVQTTSEGKSILLKGTVFNAIFQVETPAMQPTPAGPVPDPLLVKPGIAEYIVTNTSVLAG